MKSLYAADIRENQPIDDLFLVAQKNHGVTKGGSSYLTLKLLDRSGEIEARIWDRADDLGRGFDAMILSGCAARRRCIKEKCRSGCRT
jgi:Predicted HD-superfamily hydrolase